METWGVVDAVSALLGVAAFLVAALGLARARPRRVPEPWALTALAGCAGFALSLLLVAGVLERDGATVARQSALLVALVVLGLLLRRLHRRAGRPEGPDGP